MTLMPQGSFRWCSLPSCGRRWYTASPTEQPCPYCGTVAKDASQGWPHVCGRGHGAQHGGECKECVAEQNRKAKAKMKAAIEEVP